MGQAVEGLSPTVERTGWLRQRRCIDANHVVGLRLITCHFVKRSVDPHAETLWVKRLRVWVQRLNAPDG